MDDRTGGRPGPPRSGAAQGVREIAGLAELDDPEGQVVPILLDAILMVESCRGARHQISFLPELTESVHALLHELTIVERTKEWATS